MNAREISCWSPVGAADNSPAFERWVRRQKVPSPEGTVEVRSHTSSFSRPFGTWVPGWICPGVKTPGYSQDVPPGQRNAATSFFFLAPRSRSGERTEERGVLTERV